MSETPWGDARTLRTRRLRPGRGGSREAAAASQRERLYAALVALAADRGYAEVRVADLIELAGVSRGAFYEHFRAKEDLLVAVIDALVDAVTAAVGRALDREVPPEARIRAGLGAFMDLLIAQPSAARLCLIDAYGAGEAPTEHAERGTVALRELLERELARSPRHAAAPGLVLDGVVGGIRRVAITRLRAGTQAELPDMVPALAEWTLSYAAPFQPPATSRSPGGVRARYAARDQAERVLLGFCEAVAAKGYGATTIADIARHASTSTRTFYANFETKEQAYLAAIDLANAHASATALSASRRASDWPRSVRDGIAALFGFFADEPALARASVVEIYGAGEPALRHHDELIAALLGMLEPGREAKPDVPAVVLDAIGGALDALLFAGVRSGAAELRAAAPTATFLALAPFVGADEAAAMANDSGRARRTAS